MSKILANGQLFKNINKLFTMKYIIFIILTSMIIMFFNSCKNRESTSLDDMNKENFAKSIFDVIKNLPKFEKKPQVKIIKVISLEETINSLTERVKNHLKMIKIS
jgi:hypothetical protein